MRITGEQLRYITNPPTYVIGQNRESKNITVRQNEPTGVIFVPQPTLLQTSQSLLVARGVRPHMPMVAVTQIPPFLEKAIKPLDIPAAISPGYFEDEVFHSKDYPQLDAYLDHDNLATNIIFPRDSYRNGRHIAEALYYGLGIHDIRIIPNTHVGYEGIAAETAQLFGQNYAEIAFVEELSKKSKLNKLQRDLGFRVPLQSDVLEPSGNDRKDKTEILEQITRIAQLTGKNKVVLKADEGYGSISFRKIDLSLPFEEIAKSVEEHMKDREELENPSTLIEEFMEGIEVGCHITTAGGKMDITYTRKVMATGDKGTNSEEITHYIDPDEKLIQLCDSVLRPNLEAIFKARGALNYTMSYNADALLDVRYFDNDRVRDILPDSLENDESFINEINPRMGGGNLPALIGNACLVNGYPEALMKASLGESELIDTLLQATPQQAAIMHTGWSDFKGILIDFPALRDALTIPPKIFFRQQWTFVTKDPSLPDGVIRFDNIVGDYLTKGPRPIWGVTGRTLEEARKNLHIAEASDGILGLNDEGELYVNSKNGGREILIVEPKSENGKFLIEERGLDYYKGRWKLAA